MLLIATTAVATSIVPPANLGDLARASDAVVLAVAGRSHVVPSGPLLFTLTDFRVQRWVAGALSADETIVVRVPGGELDGWTWAVPGSPHFQPGQGYLLFLHADPRGQWQPQAAAYGVLRRITGRDGATLLAPLPEMTQVETFPRPDGVLPEPVGTYQEALVVAELSAVAAGRATWSAKAVLARSEQVPFDASIEGTPPTECTYITSSTPYPRWPYNTSSPPGQVNIYYSPSGGDATVPGGGSSQLAGAVGMWMGIPSSSLQIAYAGLKAGYTMSCTDTNCQSGGRPVPCYNEFSNAGMVVFNDPCSEVPAGNELAFGGPWWGPQHTFDGTAWYSIISQFVVVSATAYSRTSSSLSNYQEMLAHELGHGFGYGHFTSDPNSVMYPYCCNSIDATDVTCTQYTYPAAGPTATPTWTPTQGPTPTPTRAPTAGPTPTSTPTPPSSPPAAPSGVSASDGSYADHVQVNWNASSGADSYQVWRNAAASTQTATYLSAVAGTVYDDTSASPGTVYYYWVRAHNAAGWSGYSAPDTGFAGATSTPTPAPTPFATPTPTPGLTPTPSALVASFSFSGPAPVTGRAVQFTDTSSGVPRSWQWTFGDGASSNLRNPAHTYTSRGAFTVTLRVGDGTGSAQTSRTLTVGARARRHLEEK